MTSLLMASTQPRMLANLKRARGICLYDWAGDWEREPRPDWTPLQTLCAAMLLAARDDLSRHWPTDELWRDAYHWLHCACGDSAEWPLTFAACCTELDLDVGQVRKYLLLAQRTESQRQRWRRGGAWPRPTRGSACSAA